MSATPQETLSITITPDLRRQFEADAARLHLSPAGYFAYLMARTQPGVDPARFDRMVRTVFGKYGEVMRRLAK